MKAVSEVIAMLVLLVAIVVAFVASMIVIPEYFGAYNRVAKQASQSQILEGSQTSASISRHRGGYITIVIYNSGDGAVRVNYYVECVNYTTKATYFVGKGENIVISPGSTYQRVYRVSESDIANKVCYLTVEEPNLLIYKVLES